MASSNGNIFRVTGPLCGEFTGYRWLPLTKASDVELCCFLRCAPWIIVWVNNREAGDFRRHRAHYDVIVMDCTFLSSVYSVNDNSHTLFRLVKAIDETHMFASRSTIQYGKSSCLVPDEVLNNPSTALPAAVFVELCWAGRFKAWFKYWPGTRLVISFSKPCKSLKRKRMISVSLSNHSTTGCQLIFIARKLKMQGMAAMWSFALPVMN